MTNSQDETKDGFDLFLKWLDADRDRAGDKYEEVRYKLIRIFTSRGCSAAEELADETIRRVIRKVGELEAGYRGDPALYFYRVARNIHREYTRNRMVQLTSPSVEIDDASSTDTEERHECLDRCLQQLSAGNRELILRYFQVEKGEKRDSRERLAHELGISPAGLRVRTSRIRSALEKCVKECMKD